MNMEDYQSELIDVFYGESHHSLAEVAKKYGQTLEQCQKDWKLLEAISQKYQQLPEYEPSPFTLSKLYVHAREKFSQPAKKSFWRLFWQPAFSLATFGLVGFLVFNMAQKSDLFGKRGEQQVVATRNSTQVDRMNQRLFSTPLDNYPTHRKNTLFTNVSLGNNQEAPFSFDDDGLDSQFLSKNPTSRELELLFFRARKMEKLGYYQEALNDYQLIEKFNDEDSQYKQAVPLAMARCYEKLDRKDQAISILESYQTSFGASDDVKIWVDQLKSETF